MRGIAFVLLGLLASIIGSQAEAYCGTVPHGAAIPYDYDCARYLLCQNGIFLIKICPQDYGFSKFTGKCEYDRACWSIPPLLPKP
ncbi:unnamed protein product [Hermetia illucens]|uniref:Chitin-binding type-2 domain-containing protein n=1 Tax=Hermetia illucens TaxID=343691 RepID=A0A7R8UH17_HERIL|nr:unnamed protein product [Hermetia illucens]